MTKLIPLDAQIVAALTGGYTSTQASLVLADAKRELRGLTARADTADVACLSPLATGDEARALRQTATDQRFDADRMEACVSALSVRIYELERAEKAAERDAERERVIVERDALAAVIAEHYPRIVRQLTDLAKRIAENDRECRIVGITDSAEAIGRGVPANFYSGGGPVVRIGDRAPPTVAGTRLAWEENPWNGWQWHGLAGAE